MVLCLVALVIFSILGIFSARYRKLAKESFECVGKSIIFRPCNSRLDQRIKAKATAKLMHVNKTMAKLFYKYFTLLSWAFTILFFVSLFLTAQALYYYFTIGTCQPGLAPSSCPINKAVKILTCTYAQVIYVMIAVAVIMFLVIRYLDKKGKLN